MWFFSFSIGNKSTLFPVLFRKKSFLDQRFSENTISFAVVKHVWHAKKKYIIIIKVIIIIIIIIIIIKFYHLMYKNRLMINLNKFSCFNKNSTKYDLIVTSVKVPTPYLIFMTCNYINEPH